MNTKNTRQLLLNAAINLFSQKGYWNTSIRNIGAKAGVSNSIVYFYFKNKEELLFEILMTASQELLEILQEIDQRVSNPIECLRELLMAHIVLFSLKRKKESRIMAFDRYWLRGKRHELIVKAQRDIYDIYMRKLKDMAAMGLIADIDLTVLNFSIFAIINGFYDWYRDRGRLAHEEVGQDIVKLVLNAMLKK